jgi:CelD/BcsL family acetyltransferase involved in cellulose biosynthesis
VRACAAAFAEDLRVVQLEERGEIVAVAPLTGRAGVLELLGARDLYEPGDFLYRDEVALDELAGHVARLGPPLALHRTWADGDAVKALRGAFRGRGVVLRRPAGETPRLTLPKGRIEDRFSARRRADVRRARRRAEELGPVLAEVLSPGPADVGALLEEIVAVEAAGWKGARGTALAQDAERRRFFEEYAALSAAEGSLRVARLRIEDDTAAVQLAVEQAGRLWLLKIGYDERFARCSPGTLLMLEAANWASERGLDAIELLGGRESWTRFWTHEERPCVALYAYPARLGGAKSLVGGALGHAKRRTAQRVVDRAARSQVAGPTLEEALGAAGRVGHAVALGYWDGAADTPARVESLSLESLDGLAEAGLDAYLAIKPAALGLSPSRIATILTRAEELGLPVHMDSTGIEEAEPSWQLLEALARPGLGCTLPTRWGRTLADAKRAVELGLRVRVVKGQWPDPDFEAANERERFLQIVDAAAGAPQVAIATHDRTLATAALAQAPGAEHERMLGLPWRGADLPRTRIYVPFGHAYLPYAPGRARSSPRVALWVTRDLIRGG